MAAHMGLDTSAAGDAIGDLLQIAEWIDQRGGRVAILEFVRGRAWALAWRLEMERTSHAR